MRFELRRFNPVLGLARQVSGRSSASRGDRCSSLSAVGLLLVVLGLWSCGASAQELTKEQLEQLNALGYVAGADPATGASGVTIHDPANAQPGLNLVTSGHGPVALLMDMQGEVLHSWSASLQSIFPDHPLVKSGADPPRNFWRIARLLPNGELLVVWEMYGLFKLDRASKILWALPIRAHHDLQVTEDGRIHHLEAKRRPLSGISEKGVIDDFLVERSADGRELGRLAVSEVLEEIDWRDLRAAFWERSRARDYGLMSAARLDPFHTNALHVLSADEATWLGAPFEPGDTLISMAMLDTIAVVDRKAGKVRWWQQGPFGMQHHPRVTRDGKIVLFNNRYGPEQSAVQIFDPRSHRLGWQYGGSAGEPLYSRRSGGVEVLENGNLLVIETDRGRAFELTPDKRIVWEYRNPHRAGEKRDRVAGIYSMERMPAAALGWLPAGPE